MKRDLKTTKEALYNSNLKSLEKNLNGFVEAKREQMRAKQNQHF